MLACGLTSTPNESYMIKMYTEIPQSESQDLPLRPGHTSLHQDNALLQRRLRRLKLWNYFLSLCTTVCIGLLVFTHKSASLEYAVKGASPVPESEYSS